MRRSEKRIGPVRAPPRAVGRDALLTAVLVLDVELREKLRARTVKGAPVLGVEPDETGVPAVAEDGAEGVGSLREQRRDVVGLVLDAPVVVRPAGGEDVISYPGAVQVQFVDAAGRRVEACPADRPVQRKLLAQVRARGEAVGQVVVLVSRSAARSPRRGFCRGRSRSPSSPTFLEAPSRRRPVRCRVMDRRPRPRHAPSTRTASPTATPRPRTRCPRSGPTRPCRCPTAGSPPLRVPPRSVRPGCGRPTVPVPSPPTRAPSSAWALSRRYPRGRRDTRT